MKAHPLFEKVLSEGLFRNREGWPSWSEWAVAGKPVVEEEPERRLFQQAERLNLMEEIAQKDARIRELEEKLAETSSWDKVCALSMKRWGENLALTTEAGTNQIRNAALEEAAKLIDRPLPEGGVPDNPILLSRQKQDCTLNQAAFRIRALKK